MPSCDGSNCSVCACNCETRIEYVKDDREIQRLRFKIEQLEKELRDKKELEEIVKRIIKEEKDL